jgi:hypothetical protein
LGSRLSKSIQLRKKETNDTNQQQYETIMGSENCIQVLSARLSSFCQWVKNTGYKVHSVVLIVNGEATDCTRNAHVLLLDTSASNNSTPITNLQQKQDAVWSTKKRICFYMIRQLGYVKG